MARNLRPVEAAAEPASLHRMKTARSTEFPLRRLAVRGCERTMSEAKRRASMKRSGTSEADFRTAAIKKACRQYRAVRWFLLPEAELAAAGSVQHSGRLQIWHNLVIAV